MYFELLFISITFILYTSLYCFSILLLITIATPSISSQSLYNKSYLLFGKITIEFEISFSSYEEYEASVYSKNKEYADINKKQKD